MNSVKKTVSLSYYKNAFDSVEHEDIYKAVRNKAINETCIKIIEDIYI